MLMYKLGIDFSYLDHDKQWLGEYEFHGTRIWDSARRLEPNMYKPGSLQCLSFGFGKPLQIGSGGAILMDDKQAYHTMLLQRYDGRNLDYSPWQDQKVFALGYHYRPTPEQAITGSSLLEGLKENRSLPIFKQYPDLRLIKIIT